jgi:hypothetical protein
LTGGDEDVVRQLTQQELNDTTALYHRAFGSRGDALGVIFQFASSATRGYAQELVAILLWEMARRLPNAVLPAPAYHLDYEDDRHLDGWGTRVRAEYEALAIARAMLTGSTALEMDWMERDMRVRGMTVTVPIDGSYLRPLVFDTNWVVNDGAYGFRLFDERGQLGVTSNDIAIRFGEELEFSLSRFPVGQIKIAAGAYGTPGAPAGPATGARCCLRDSNMARVAMIDPATSGYPGRRREMPAFMPISQIQGGTDPWL